MSIGGDSVRVAHPLFQMEGGGSTPTSPLQLEFGKIHVSLARKLNATWHSRLPDITNWQQCSHCYAAIFDGIYFASAMWGAPIAREFNGRNYLELRRFAISPESPKNTATRMISWMIRQIRKDGFVKAISYQDSSVHCGTIYKASGWEAVGFRKGGKNAWTSNARERALAQADGDKIRWELDLTC